MRINFIPCAWGITTVDAQQHHQARTLFYKPFQNLDLLISFYIPPVTGIMRIYTVIIERTFIVIDTKPNSDSITSFFGLAGVLNQLLETDELDTKATSARGEHGFAFCCQIRSSCRCGNVAIFQHPGTKRTKQARQNSFIWYKKSGYG